MNLSFNLAVTLVALVLMTLFWRKLNLHLEAPPDDQRKALRARHARRAAHAGIAIGLESEARSLVDLRRLLDDMPRQCESLLRSGGVGLVHQASNAALGVLARPAELRQLLDHVLAIACHAMPRGGVLRMRSAAEERHALVEFIDAGRGHPEPLLAALFEHGMRQPAAGAAGSLAENVASCRRIVAAHDGRIGTSPALGSNLPALSIRLPLQHQAARVPLRGAKGALRPKPERDAGA